MKGINRIYWTINRNKSKIYIWFSNRHYIFIWIVFGFFRQFAISLKANRPRLHGFNVRLKLDQRQQLYLQMTTAEDLKSNRDVLPTLHQTTADNHLVSSSSCPPFRTHANTADISEMVAESVVERKN